MTTSSLPAVHTHGGRATCLVLGRARHDSRPRAQRDLQRRASHRGHAATIWKVPGSDHTGGIDAEPLEYERRVGTFSDDALLATTDDPEGDRK